MAVEKGKPVDEQDHQSLALWAADCAEHVLAYFQEKHPQGDRPRNAIEAGRAWVRGEMPMIEARTAALAAHAAARGADDDAACAAARAAGHAAATAHVATHARHAAAYAVKAVNSAADDTASAAIEREWQHRRGSEHLRPLAFPTVSSN